METWNKPEESNKIAFTFTKMQLFALFINQHYSLSHNEFVNCFKIFWHIIFQVRRGGSAVDNTEYKAAHSISLRCGCHSNH